MTHSEAGKLGSERLKNTLKEQLNKRIEEYNKNPKLCKQCGSPLPYEKRENTFCNHSCCASFNNKGVCHNGQTCTKVCLNCGKKLNLNIKKFCDAKCQQDFYRKQREDAILKTGDLSCGWIKEHSIRKYLLKVRPHICEICGTSEWTSKEIPLVMDHIDGNSDNWLETNLRLICPNCDAQTDTYKSKNRGKGRFARRQRYKEGKSY